MNVMTPIVSSASKIVFLLIALCVCIGFLTKLLTQDNFMYIATSVFSYYFGVTVGGLPDGGKPMPVIAPPVIPPAAPEMAQAAPTTAQMAVK